jgi:transposase InsO family protein
MDRGIAAQNMEASTVADVIAEQFILGFGAPKVIHSDQGRQYESRLFKELCKVLGIHKSRTTAFHPKSDGMFEHFNKK